MLNGGKPINAAYYRDNTLDILEELRDAEVILGLLEERLMYLTLVHPERVLPALQKMHKTIEDAADAAVALRDALPWTVVHDDNDVIETKRLVTP